METYKDMRNRQEQETHAFIAEHAFFAFTDEQFNEGLVKLGIAKGEAVKVLVHIGANCYMLKSKRDAYKALAEKQEAELMENIAQDPTGDGFIFDMFYYELGNHEYAITGELGPSLMACGISVQDLKDNPALYEGLKKAVKQVVKDYS